MRMATLLHSRDAVVTVRPPARSRGPVLSSFRYVADGSRDLRIDMARGLAIVVMVTNHLTGSSYLNAVTQGRIYVSAAEAFVFLSGFVLGFASLRRAEDGGLRAASRALVARAGTLYRTYLVLAVVAAVVTLVHAGAAAPIFRELATPPWKAMLAIPIFGVSPRLLDVLQLYVLLLCASPVALYALRRGWTAPLLLASAAAWAFHQFHPYALSATPLGREHPYFVLAAWQLVYVVGFVFGYHRTALSNVLRRAPGWLLPTLAVAGVAASVVANHLDTRLGVWPVGVVDRAFWTAATDRSSMGFARLPSAAALFTLIFSLFDRFYRLFARTIGHGLVALGQSSLYVFVVHIPFVVAWHALGLPMQSAQITTIVQLGVLVALLAMVRSRFLFNVVPR